MINREDYYIENNQVELYGSLSVPSTVHGYSLAIEYMRDWFLKEFDKSFFKSIYVDGKYIFDDLVQYKKYSLLNKAKPMLAMVPTVNTDYNRENLDLQLSGRNLFMRRALYHNYSFLQDIEHNQYLGVKMRALEMDFIFKIRVGTRAQQLDLLRYMELAFRVGSTQGEYISADFHVPNEIMLTIANNAGYEIIPERNGDRYRVKDIPSFLSYLNSISHYPFIYKYRAINGNSEFFIRMDRVYMHISNLDPIQKDDGEREGVNDNNFHLEMNCQLHIPVPHYYYLYSNTSLDTRYRERNNLEGLYQISKFHIEPPETNKKGWRQYISTEYVEDTNEFTTIEFEELLENSDLMRVMKYSRDSGISPALFMDVIIYNCHEEIVIDIDWEKFLILINRTLPDNMLMITIYLDLEYVNNSIDVIDELYKNRYTVDDTV